jgi:hypothetical protein
MIDKKLSRKNFLVTAGVVGTTLVLGSSIITCKKEEKPNEQAKQEGPKCDDVSGLKPEEIEQRKNLQYTDNTPDPAKNCANCALYIAPQNNAPCGGCNLIKGPVSPNGWCTSWVPKA